LKIQTANEVKLIYDEIKKTIENEGFDKAALIFSSSNTSSSGGKLGWIQEETLNKNLKKILSKMSENEITSPITVPGGFMVLKINQIKKEKKKSRYR
jgi:peptidyl-prolyl cis-trans isomerase SurA